MAVHLFLKLKQLISYNITQCFLRTHWFIADNKNKTNKKTKIWTENNLFFLIKTLKAHPAILDEIVFNYP